MSPVKQVYGRFIMKKESKYRKGLERILASGVIFFSGLVGGVDAGPGYLKIKNNLNSHQNFVNLNRDDNSYPEATDGFDNGYDGSSNSQPPGYPDIYTNITTHTLWDDVRAENSVADYDVRLSFSGSLPSTQSNWLNFSLPYAGYDFGDAPILFESDRMPYGPVVDVRAVINKNSGNLPLIEALAGTTGEYGTGTLTIGTRILGDFDDNGNVGVTDHNDLGQLHDDWLAQGSGLVSDISGPNGIPDGKVNLIDYSAYADDYRKSL